MAVSGLAFASSATDLVIPRMRTRITMMTAMMWTTMTSDDDDYNEDGDEVGAAVDGNDDGDRDRASRNL